VLFSLVVSLVYDVHHQPDLFIYFAENILYVFYQVWGQFHNFLRALSANAVTLDIIIEMLWFKLTAPATKYEQFICFSIDHTMIQCKIREAQQETLD
jgi:hypothetical protein